MSIRPSAWPSTCSMALLTARLGRSCANSEMFQTPVPRLLHCGPRPRPRRTTTVRRSRESDMAVDPAYIRNFKALARGGISEADLAAIERELYGGSDRARAVLL